MGCVGGFKDKKEKSNTTIKISKKIKTREGRKKKYIVLQFGDEGRQCHHKLQ